MYRFFVTHEGFLPVILLFPFSPFLCLSLHVDVLFKPGESARETSLRDAPSGESAPAKFGTRSRATFPGQIAAEMLIVVLLGDYRPTCLFCCSMPTRTMRALMNWSLANSKKNRLKRWLALSELGLYIYIKREIIKTLQYLLFLFPPLPLPNVSNAVPGHSLKVPPQLDAGHGLLHI